MLLVLVLCLCAWLVPSEAMRCPGTEGRAGCELPMKTLQEETVLFLTAEPSR